MKMLAKTRQPAHSPLLFSAITAGAASAISLIGGIGIEAVQHRLLPLAPLVIALPALNTMVGDYAAIIAAHAGDPADRKQSRKALARAISKAMLVNIVGVIALSLLVAWHRGYVAEADFIVKFAVFVVISFASIIAAMFMLTIGLDKLLANRQINPDDVLIPIVTSITDVGMLGLIALAALLLF